jgi:hypothetical protein
VKEKKLQIAILAQIGLLVDDFIDSHKKLEQLCSFKITPLKEIL